MKEEDVFYLGLFGYCWRICTGREVRAFGFSQRVDVPVALSGSFKTKEEAQAECAERNKRIFN